MNIFKGLSRQEIGIVVIVGTAIAIVVVIMLVAIVSSFPISDASKYKVLFGLGVASLFVGYWLLTRKRMPPKIQTRKPATVKPITHSHDVCNGVNEINRNFCQYPAQPSQAIAISSPPTTTQAKTANAFPILSSFHRYLIGVLHNVL
jgi:hypothetical protein